jgi:hypothetical protein
MRKWGVEGADAGSVYPNFVVSVADFKRYKALIKRRSFVDM